MLIDNHCHAGLNWFEPIELLEYQMMLNNVSKAVLIQHGGNYDNSYLIECAEQQPDKFSVVVSVDNNNKNSPNILKQLAKNTKVVGVRLRPTDRFFHGDPLTLWKVAESEGLAISCFAVNANHCATTEFENIVQEISNTNIILEHLGGVYISRTPEVTHPPFTAFKKVLQLAQYKNTYIKFGGIGEFCERPETLTPGTGFEEIPPLIDMAVNAFGYQRMMWGSDYSPVSQREGYSNALNLPLSLDIFKSQDSKEYVLAKTAIDCWKL
jgi:predicted TIM-barrel fold metal-dependent hydrolase